MYNGNMSDDDKILLAHMDDLGRRALREGWAASKFLTPEQAAQAGSHALLSGVELRFTGGFHGAERTRAVFVNSDWGSVSDDELILAFYIENRSERPLGHRDILGALMAAGLQREALGDVIILADSGAGPRCAAFACLPELERYITSNFERAGHASLTLEKIAPDAMPERRDKIEYKTDTVASLRLDSVVGAAWDLSRSDAAELIARGAVSVGHIQCARPDRLLEPGALISARGHGRAVLAEVGGLSRKDRVFIKIGKYV